MPQNKADSTFRWAGGKNQRQIASGKRDKEFFKGNDEGGGILLTVRFRTVRVTDPLQLSQQRANQWRLKEGAKNDRLKKSVATFARARWRRMNEVVRSVTHAPPSMSSRPRLIFGSAVSIRGNTSPKSQIAATLCRPPPRPFSLLLIQFHNAEESSESVSRDPVLFSPIRSSYSQSLRCNTLVHSSAACSPHSLAGHT